MRSKENLIFKCSFAMCWDKIRNLENALWVQHYQFGKEPDTKIIKIKRETSQLIWAKHNPNSDKYEGAIGINEIKEVRKGYKSKDFEDQYSEVTKGKCFVILYGAEFNLKTLSVMVHSSNTEIYNQWIEGLIYLTKYYEKYPLRIYRWLSREFNLLQNLNNCINLEGLKRFLQEIKYKLTDQALQELFKSVDTKDKFEIGFDGFNQIYQKLVYKALSEQPHFKEIQKYANDNEEIYPSDFECFMRDQNDPLGNETVLLTEYISNYLEEDERNEEEPYFRLPEFCDFLFSKQNDLWNPKHDLVYQDMTKPLSHYWIASSHNTYLTGHQLTGESSVECYIRCLRMGCKCIEIDCWDGYDGIPIIYHGHTLTTKIKLKDVLNAIKEYAFETSEFPVILSIEDNCSVTQQKVIASYLQEVFGDILLTQKISVNETELPSPHLLKRKIIVKHKTLPKYQKDEHVTLKDDILDCKHANHHGNMYIFDPKTHSWIQNYFILKKSKLIYIEGTKLQPEVSESCNEHFGECSGLHFSQNWFYGNMFKGRGEASTLLKQYLHLGDGTFLVRMSKTFSNDYSLSFIYNNTIHHCHIFKILTQKNDEGKKYEEEKCEVKKDNEKEQGGKVYINDGNIFDSLFCLIMYYRKNPLVAKGITVILKETVPRPKWHKSETWYHEKTSKSQAEVILNRKGIEGAFLVRRSDYPYDFAISFYHTDGQIKHCHIKPDGRLYLIAQRHFESLVELINYYKTHALYKSIKLTEAITVEEVKSISEADILDNNPGIYRDYFPSPTLKPEESAYIKGNWNISDVNTRVIKNSEPSELEARLIIFLNNDKLEFGVRRISDAAKWAAEIQRKNTEPNAEDRRLESRMKIAKEISDLTIYCRATRFNTKMVENVNFEYTQMSSFSEIKAETLMCTELKAFFIKYHQKQLSRVFPKAHRFASSNFNPTNMWMSGSQMVALNYQTGDKWMQINQAKFRDNGKCGYLLKPEFMFREDFDPKTYSNPWKITIQILAGRNLYIAKPTGGSANPYVEIQIVGDQFETRPEKIQKMHKMTKQINDNGFNPIWIDETCTFTVQNPDFAFIRFSVWDTDMWKNPIFIGHATYPVKCIRTGYRSVWLQNEYSEDYWISSLLVHVSIKKETAKSKAPIAKTRSKINERF